MTTTAQQAFKDFQDKQMKDDFDFDLLSKEDKQAEMEEYTKLKIATQKEIKANQEEQQEAAIQSNTKNRNTIIQQAKEDGYTCDNSEKDWVKLYESRPDITGQNRVNLAKELSKVRSLDNFLREYIRINK